MITVFGVALAGLLSYSLLLRWGLHRARRHSPAASDAVPSISVVVAARNEEDALPTLLSALDQQTHPSYEVVLVDDASSDETSALAKSWVQERPYAQYLRVQTPTPPRKKNALTQGIASAQHSLMAFTDADCTPPPQWLSVLAASHASTPEETVLVGYSPLRGTGLLGNFSQYETFIAGTYAAATAGLGRPYLAVGRNLSYPRPVFERVGGFSASQDALSGDDDLFVQSVHRQEAATVRAVLDDRSHVPSEAPRTWREWLHQKRRHVSAGRLYPWTVGLHLTVLHGCLLALWSAPFFLGTLGVGILATGLLTRHTLLGPASDTFHEGEVVALFPLWELGYALYHLLVVPLGLLLPPEEWDPPS